MNKFIKIFIILFFFLFISCSKEEKPQNEKNNNKKESVTQGDVQDNSSDTAMTPEERFSSSITLDFLDTPEDEDLTDYLEEQLFKYSQTYRGASVMQLSNTIWFVTMENNNSTKNFLLQKFVDFNSNDYYFVLKETNLGTADILASANLFRNSTVLKSKDTQTTAGQTQK